ncbi:hypothetical protein [Clostridioides sp. ZZV14-6345]|uniref:hypothetical protein n=1 Tax=Clostridioides sp. ZZV14-6345 TaxID=2811496 RepID=UPI001D10242B|nr:hypothetical protein [Clostridioides sp. ZZV14-6345]
MISIYIFLWTDILTRVDILMNFKIGQDEKGNKSIKNIKYFYKFIEFIHKKVIAIHL